MATGLVLLVGDACAGVLALAAALFAARWTGIAVGGEEMLLLLVFVALLHAALTVAQLYPGAGIGRVDELRLLTLSTTSVFVAFAPAVIILLGFAEVSVLTFVWVVALVTIPSMRGFVRDLAARYSWWGVPVVVLGAGRAGSALMKRLRDDPQAGLVPVAAFDDNVALIGSRIHGVPVVGTLADSGRYAQEGVRHALVAVPSAGAGRLREVIRDHAKEYPSLIVVPDLFGLGSVNGAVCRFDGFMGLKVRQNLLIRRNLVVKRVMDLILLVPAALFALPVVGLAAFAIRCVSPGNPFYGQERIGSGGTPFKVWKLRTMYVDAEERLERYLETNPEAREEWRTKFKLAHDARILPGVGRFLRVSSLDELPQLWNIALGQMSFVGPRPFPAYHMQAFDEEFRRLRTQVAPGLTGLWQVTARSESNLEIQQELDSLYIANWSPWTDIYLLARTPRAVIRGHGAV